MSATGSTAEATLHLELQNHALLTMLPDASFRFAAALLPAWSGHIRIFTNGTFTEEVEVTDNHQGWTRRVGTWRINSATRDPKLSKCKLSLHWETASTISGDVSLTTTDQGSNWEDEATGLFLANPLPGPWFRTIVTEKCFACHGGMVFKSCAKPHACAATCSDPHSSGASCEGANVDCVARCDCPNGTVWGGEGRGCVLANVCGCQSHPLEPPPHGSMHATAHDVNYSCDPGYLLNGVTARKCNDGGSWDGARPTCHLDMCAVTELPADDSNGNGHSNGNVAVSRDPAAGTKVATYTCAKGFELVGSAVRSCAANGQWDGLPASCAPR